MSSSDDAGSPSARREPSGHRYRVHATVSGGGTPAGPVDRAVSAIAGKFAPAEYAFVSAAWGVHTVF